jgi:hypothetical protein
MRTVKGRGRECDEVEGGYTEPNLRAFSTARVREPNEMAFLAGGPFRRANFHYQASFQTTHNCQLREYLEKAISGKRDGRGVLTD